MNNYKTYLMLAVQNIRYFQMVSFVLALVLCGLMIPFFGVVQLTETATMQILARILPLLGLVLIAPVLQHEFDPEIADIMWTKKFAYWKTICLRLVIAFVMAIILYGVYLTILWMNDSTFLWSHVLHSLINLLFLGSLALLVMALTKNSTVGYMVAIIYYLMNFFMAKKLGMFYLFQMKEMKWLLLLCACISLWGAVYYRWKNK